CSGVISRSQIIGGSGLGVVIGRYHFCCAHVREKEKHFTPIGIITAKARPAGGGCIIYLPITIAIYHACKVHRSFIEITGNGIKFHFEITVRKLKLVQLCYLTRDLGSVHQRYPHEYTGGYRANNKYHHSHFYKREAFLRK